MKRAIITAIITILIVQAIVLVVVAESGWRIFHRSFGAYNFLAGLLGLVPGLALVFIKETRAVGQGILIGCGVMLVIGYALCTNLP